MLGERGSSTASSCGIDGEAAAGINSVLLIGLTTQVSGLILKSIERCATLETMV